MTRQKFVTRLLDLGRRHGEIPVYASDEWETLDDLDPRRFASIVRAAECWRLDGEEEAVKRRLQEDDWLVQLRVREAGLDIHGRGDTDWVRVFDVVQARAGGDQPPERTPQPWTAADVDPTIWQDDPNPSPNVPPRLRFGRHTIRVVA